MGIFNQKTKFKVAAPTIRKIVVPVEAEKPKPKPNDRENYRPREASSTPSHPSSLNSRLGGSARSSKTPSASPRVSSPAPRHKSHSPYPPSADERTSQRSRNGERKRKLVGLSVQRSSPAMNRVDFGQESDSDDGAEGDAWINKRRKTNKSQHKNPDRRLAHPVLLETLSKSNEVLKEDTCREVIQKRGADAVRLAIIHAADVASLKVKCVPVLGATDDEVPVELQYPGSRQRERFELVWGKDKIDAVKDIKATVWCTAEMYLTSEQADPFLNPTTGIVRHLDRASSDQVKDVKMFKSALDDFNKRLLAMHNNGTIAKNLSQEHVLPSHLVAFILDQVYDRTVAPKVDLLRKYENGTDNVYGELLHPFITNILVEKLGMTSDQVFVDLGSGVGNVVLQAALEIGCESWGCEMMENACNLAEEQQKEFGERCRLWGIAAGDVHLERGDFRSNVPIQDALKRADVVLVNNQAFTSQLNDDLVRMFLDFKTGCKIVSLKSFVHDHKSASHNINDVGNTILDVELHRYPEGHVSWTGAAGSFCISTRK